MSNGTEADALGDIIRAAMEAAGYLTERGHVNVEAERRIGINRMTLDRLLASPGDIKSDQLGRIAAALGTTRSQLMLRAEGVAA
jgi:hypothetical protein